MTNKQELKDFRRIDAELDTCRVRKSKSIAICEKKKSLIGF